MAATVGMTGLVSSSDTGKDLYWLINTGTDPYSANVTIAGEAFAVPAFNNTAPIATDQIAGLKSWSGSFNARFPSGGAASGHTGLVTFANGYTTLIRGWTITASIAELDTTMQATTPPTWMTYVPGLASYSGSYECLVDSATAISAPSTGAATFRISTEATNDNELAGSIVVTGVAVTGRVGDLWRVTVSFTVNGNLTTDGDSSFLEVTTAGTPLSLTTPDITAISIRTAGSRTYTGDAFVTGWTIGSRIGSAIESTVNFRGTGELTIG